MIHIQRADRQSVEFVRIRFPRDFRSVPVHVRASKIVWSAAGRRRVKWNTVAFERAPRPATNRKRRGAEETRGGLEIVVFLDWASSRSEIGESYGFSLPARQRPPAFLRENNSPARVRAAASRRNDKSTTASAVFCPRALRRRCSCLRSAAVESLV